MRVDQLQQLGVDRGPDRAPRRLRRRPAGRGRATGVCVGLDHRLDRHVDLQVELLAHAGVDDPAGAARADHEAADLLERVLGGRQPDPLHVAARPPRPGARASAPGARRAWSRRPRGSRRRCTSARPRTAPARARSASGTATPGVVIRMSGGSRSIAGARAGACRRCAPRPRARPRSRAAACAGCGRCRRRAPSAARRRRGAIRRSRGVARAGRVVGAAGRSPTGTRPASCPSRSGREISTCSPEAIAGQACSCAAVGASNAPVNQSRVRGLKASNDTLARLPGADSESMRASWVDSPQNRGVPRRSEASPISMIAGPSP